jgi:hypothetical protein
LFRTAFWRVVSVGENSAAWANATSSAVLSTWLTMWVLWEVGVVDGSTGIAGGSSTGTDQRRVLGFRRPLRIVALRNLMSTLCWSKTAVQPTSHNCPTDSRECGCRAGNRCAMVAVVGIIGICSWVDAIDSICWPSGRRTVMLGVSVSLMVGRWSVVKK